LLKNVRFYNAQGNHLQLSGAFEEVRFCTEQRLLKSTGARMRWVVEELEFQAKYLNARMDSQEAWAPASWKFHARDNSFGEGLDAYGYKDKLGNMYAQTQMPLRLWQNENVLNAQKAYCEANTKKCEFMGAVKTTLSKAE